MGVVLGALALLALGGGPALAAAPPFAAHGSAEQVYVTGLGSKQQAILLDASGRTIQSASADLLGGLVFRNVKPGSGYRVRAGIRRPGVRALTVLPTRRRRRARASTTRRFRRAATAT